MKVINLTDSPYVIQIIPRTYNVTNAHTFSLTDDDFRTTTDVSNTKALNAGYIDYTVSLTGVTEGKSYSVKITDDVTTAVVWRGNVFATAQTTQNYRINE